MPKKLKVKLNDKQMADIEKAINKDKRPEVRQRAAALNSLHQGHSVKEVANLLAVTVQSVYNWLHRWEEKGVEGLANQSKSGRKRKADEQYCRELEIAIEQEPREQGYRFAIWTVKRLRDHLEDKTGVHMSISRLRYVIEERGYVYRRPKHDLTNVQDLEAKEQAKELLEELKRGRSRTISSSSLWTKRP